MSSKLILVRHGETEGNVAKRLDTRLPGAPLTELGVAQAKALGAQLAPPVALVSSRALRARQTAGHLEEATGVAVQVLDNLHEVQAGEFEDRTDKEAHDIFKRVFHAWHDGDLSQHLPGGETGQQVLDRYVPVLTELRHKYLHHNGSGTVVVVSHGAAIRLVAKTLAGVDGTFAANNHLDNTETVELIPKHGGGWECVRWAKHTPPFAPQAARVPDDPMG